MKQRLMAQAAAAKAVSPRHTSSGRRPYKMRINGPRSAAKSTSHHTSVTVCPRMDGRRTGLLRRGEVAASRFCDMEEQALHRTQADAGWRMYYWTCSDCRTQSQNTRQACHATPITLPRCAAYDLARIPLGERSASHHPCPLSCPRPRSPTSLPTQAEEAAAGGGGAAPAGAGADAGTTKFSAADDVLWKIQVLPPLFSGRRLH